MNETVMVGSLRSGDIVRVHNERCEVLGRLITSKRGAPRLIVRRLDADGRGATVRFDHDHDRVELIERQKRDHP